MGIYFNEYKSVAGIVGRVVTRQGIYQSAAGGGVARLERMWLN